jgi:hypothetical protein
VRACRESGEDREGGSLCFSLSESREPGRTETKRAERTQRAGRQRAEEDRENGEVREWGGYRIGC